MERLILDLGFWISTVLMIACAIGCDEKKVAPARPKPVFGTGTIRGVVKFTGTPPPRAAIANQPCHEGAPELKDETVIVNDNGTLANTFVYLEGVPASDGSDRAPALLDQKDCRYAPHVLAAQVGQAIRIRSSDATLHNVHYSTTANASGNFALTAAGSEKTVTFLQPEFIRAKCDVHPWMTAYIGVFENPFFSVSNTNDGAYTIERIPAGSYKIVAWHEQYGRVEQAVTVKENETIDVELTYQAK